MMEPCLGPRRPGAGYVTEAHGRASVAPTGSTIAAPLTPIRAIVCGAFSPCRPDRERRTVDADRPARPLASRTDC